MGEIALYGLLVDSGCQSETVQSLSNSVYRIAVTFVII